MNVRGGPLSDREAQAVMEVIGRYQAAVAGLVDVVCGAAELSDDAVVCELLAAGADTAAAQLAAIADSAAAAWAESQAEAAGGA